MKNERGGGGVVASGEPRFQELVEALPQLVFTADEDGQCDFVNKRYVEYTGLPTQAMMGLGWTEICHPDDRAMMFATWTTAMNTRGRVRMECRIRRHDGVHRWFVMEAVPVYDAADQKITKWVSSCTDIQDTRDGLAALERERDRLSRVVACSPSVLYGWRRGPDGNSAYLFIGAGIMDLCGETVETFLSDPKALRKRMHPDDMKAVDAIGVEAIASMIPWRAQFRLLHPTKGEIWIDGQAMPIEEADGGLVWYGSLVDVTSRKRAEEELRTKQRMESIGQLAGGIAHDFNNLLTIIIACTDEVLMSIREDDPNREPLLETRLAVQRATSLTHDLLAFSRRQIMESKIVDLNDIVAEASRMLRRLLGEDVILATAFCPATPLVRIDPGQWTSVLINLAVNARHAMPKGGTLTLRTTNCTMGDKRWALLEVQDTGCGFSGDVAARIFEPFFTTKGIGKGTGLGLAVVHGIVEQCGGRIEVMSSPGVGTTFRILLPAIDDVEPLITTHGEQHRDAQEDANDTIKAIVLFVEDEVAVRRAAVRSLETRGFEVLSAGDAEEALSILRERSGRIDIVVTDVVLPKMDGRRLVEAVGQYYPRIKVLYTSGYTNDDVLRYGVSCAEVAFLQKPYTPRRLVRKMREILSVTEHEH